MKHDTFSLGPPCYEPGGCVQGCRACQYEKLQTENTKLRAEVKEWKDAARKEREYSLGVEKNRDSIVLQLSEEKKLSTLWMEKSDENEKAAIAFRLEIKAFREECARARMAWKSPKMDSSHVSPFLDLMEKWGKGSMCSHKWGLWIKSSDREGQEFKRCENCTILEYRTMTEKRKCQTCGGINPNLCSACMGNGLDG